MPGPHPLTDILTAQSEVIRRISDCSQTSIDDQFRQDQVSIVAGFGSQTHPHLFMSGPHHLVSLRGAGVGFVPGPTPDGALDLAANGGPTLGSPSLLLYSPRPRRQGESEQEYLRAITDIFPDPPYTLIGWVYGKPMISTTRPVFQNGCVASDQWFIHEAGYHLNNGNMILEAPTEAVAGSVWRTLPVNPPFGGIFHPRIWDLHVWRSPTGRPSLSINARTRQPGLVLPAGTFFTPETFE